MKIGGVDAIADPLFDIQLFVEKRAENVDLIGQLWVHFPQVIQPKPGKCQLGEETN